MAAALGGGVLHRGAGRRRDLHGVDRAPVRLTGSLGGAAPAGAPVGDTLLGDAERSLLARPAPEIAPLLLGAVLTHRTADGTVAVRLTEVEAYQGQGADPGSHAHRGRTPRTEVMFGPPGHLYAYFTYGMHVCANVVVEREGLAAGILLRAGEVVEGRDLAAVRRAAAPFRDLARGPARLASAMGIRLDETGADLLEAGGAFALELPPAAVPFESGPRTGVSGPGGGPDYPWRFWMPGEPSVSPYRPAKPRIRTRLGSLPS